VHFPGGFPDCVATRDNSKIRIEFELKSSNFLSHKHDPSQCDLVVCWIDDCPRLREFLEVEEFQRVFGLGFNVWFQGAKGGFAEGISELLDSDLWSVALGAHKGDLVLFWRAHPYSSLRDIFELEEDARYIPSPDWRSEPDYMAQIKRVATLDEPIHWDELKNHPHLRDSNFVRRNMQGRICATFHWSWLYQMIIATNPQCAGALVRFL
jgi:hypothetical protein